MKNKKGFLLGEETLKIIVAVICILLLVFLLFGIYSVFIEKKKLIQAKENLDEIGDAIKEGRGIVRILGPSSLVRSWFLEDFYSNEKVPEQCKEWEHCLCICASTLTNILDSDNVDTCDAYGVCIESENVVVWDLGRRNIIYVDNNPILNIEKTDGGFKITRTEK